MYVGKQPCKRRTWQTFADLLPSLQEGHIAQMCAPKIADTIYNQEAAFSEAQVPYAQLYHIFFRDLCQPYSAEAVQELG